MALKYDLTHGLQYVLLYLAICDAGYEDRSAEVAFCEEYSIGYWKDSRSASTCQLCPTHVVTNTTGATSQEHCNVG